MRGYNKRVFHLKNTGSYLFDEALFIVRKDCETTSLRQGDMVVEANRIIEESLREAEPCKRGEREVFLKGTLIPFFVGAFTASLIAFLIYLF